MAEDLIRAGRALFAQVMNEQEDCRHLQWATPFFVLALKP